MASFRFWALHNWRLKLAALGLSVFLWALVQTEPRNAETFSSVPVVVEVADTAWLPAGPPVPATVELRLSGPTREIIRLAREGTVVRVPVAEVNSTDSLITLRRDWVPLGEGTGLSVESVLPSAIRVSFEPAVTRVVPVSLRLEGSLPGHLALASRIGLTPPVVRLRGPASRVEALDSVRLAPLDLGSVTESGIYEVAVDTAGLGGTRVAPPQATLGIRVEPQVERVLRGVPVLAQAEAGQATISVTPGFVEVTLVGARTLVTAVDPRDLRVWVAGELLRGMVRGEERRVPLRVEGAPELVTVLPSTDLVTVRRSSDEDGDGR